MRILVYGAAWIGDAVMTQVAFKLIKQENPTTQIDVLAPSWTAPLYECMPEVSQTIPLPFKHGDFKLIQRYQLGKSLRGNRYDQAILIPNSFKSALIPYFARIPKITGFNREGRRLLLNDARILNPQIMPLMVDRLAALALPPLAPIPQKLPWPSLLMQENGQQAVIQKFKLSLTQPVLVFCPGAEFGSSKRWPTEYFAEVARYFAEKGWQVWILGSSKDSPLAEAIQAPSTFNFAGKTTLLEALHLMSFAKAVLTNDTGLMHMAAALDKPIVALYGSSSPDFTPPLALQVKVLRTGIACSPCFERKCPLEHHRCMRDLNSSIAIHALEELCGF